MLFIVKIIFWIMWNLIRKPSIHNQSILEGKHWKLALKIHKFKQSSKHLEP